MSKRVQLMRTVRGFHMENLLTYPDYHPEYGRTAWIITKLDRRLKKKKRSKVEQINMFDMKEFKCRFVKNRGMRIYKETLLAISSKSARKELREMYGKKIKILTVKS